MWSENTNMYHRTGYEGATIWGREHHHLNKSPKVIHPPLSCDSGLFIPAQRLILRDGDIMLSLDTGKIISAQGAYDYFIFILGHVKNGDGYKLDEIKINRFEKTLINPYKFVENGKLKVRHFSRNYLSRRHHVLL